MNAGRCRYAAVTHEPEHVLLVDKVLAWSVGEKYHAEVDICLPPESASFTLEPACRRQYQPLASGVACPYPNQSYRLHFAYSTCRCDRARGVRSAAETSARHRGTVGGAVRILARCVTDAFRLHSRPGPITDVIRFVVVDIERCHVHLDWETEHKAEHQGKDGGLFSLPSRSEASPRATIALAARSASVAGEAEQEVSSDSRVGEAGEEGKPTPQATKGDATGAATPRP